MSTSQHTDIARAARELLGFEHLRPGQEDAVRAVLAGRDTLAVLPTGSGKSAIYELATALGGGPTVVVSPLLALQRDQIEKIEQEDIGSAAALNSTLSETRREELLEELDDDELEYLFLAPEQFASEETLEKLREAKPTLLVVDEAHSISEWGHDFRPEYLRLGSVAELLGNPTTLALTATAAPPVRAEIVERLGLRDPVEVIRGFDRPNIHLAVDDHHDENQKLRALVQHVAGGERPAIVYTATRRRSEELAEELREAGVSALAYHAGLRRHEREAAQTAFMDDDDVEVVVATIAFGMGVDKPNVRAVVHAEISDSVDAYYQEIGRGGRDGEPARAVLFYRPEDVGLRRFFAGAGQLAVDEALAIAETVDDAGGPLDAHALHEATGLSETKILAALGRLEDVGFVELLPDGEVTKADGALAVDDAAEAAAAAQHSRKEYERTRVEMVRGYAETTGCRREYVLSYFGEAFEGPCGNCDNCDAGLTRADRRDRPFEVGASVRHPELGDGTVQRYDGDTVVVLFDEHGYRTLALDLVVERGLLSET
ncbi:MAG TPA: RecQ family ATP-dependent DNA helicase [Gaiellaceae bacterium]